MILIMTGLINGLVPAMNQAISWTNFSVLSIGHQGLNFHWHFNQNMKLFPQENAFEHNVSKMSAILFRPQGVN